MPYALVAAIQTALRGDWFRDAVDWFSKAVVPDEALKFLFSGRSLAFFESR